MLEGLLELTSRALQLPSLLGLVLGLDAGVKLLSRLRLSLLPRVFGESIKNIPVKVEGSLCSWTRIPYASTVPDIDIKPGTPLGPFTD